MCIIENTFFMRFQNKTILITGASRGIGKSLAHAFAREGANLVLTARTQTDLEKVAADIQHQYGVRVVPVVGDVSDEDHAKAAVEIAVKEFKQIHVLINNAAISGMRPIYGLQKASWEKTLAV
ncbi:MAG: SDR family NAD(P)-dependent oxidoreductase, partial [Chloroflexi bacterium]|nr:SDR family NAD(P)-dependent oxidoreductase [Chloroflexota bacterium]